MGKKVWLTDQYLFVMPMLEKYWHVNHWILTPLFGTCTTETARLSKKGVQPTQRTNLVWPDPFFMQGVID